MSTFRIVLLVLVGLCTAWGIFESVREWKQKKRLRLIAWDLWLDASVELGTWVKEHPFSSREHPGYQELLEKELIHFTLYLKLKRLVSPQETILLNKLRSRRVRKPFTEPASD